MKCLCLEVRSSRLWHVRFPSKLRAYHPLNESSTSRNGLTRFRQCSMTSSSSSIFPSSGHSSFERFTKPPHAAAVLALLVNTSVSVGRLHPELVPGVGFDSVFVQNMTNHFPRMMESEPSSAFVQRPLNPEPHFPDTYSRFQLFFIPRRPLFSCCHVPIISSYGATHWLPGLVCSNVQRQYWLIYKTDGLIALSTTHGKILQFPFASLFDRSFGFRNEIRVSSRLQEIRGLPESVVTGFHRGWSPITVRKNPRSRRNFKFIAYRVWHKLSLSLINWVIKW